MIWGSSQLGLIWTSQQRVRKFFWVFMVSWICSSMIFSSGFNRAGQSFGLPLVKHIALTNVLDRIWKSIFPIKSVDNKKSSIIFQLCGERRVCLISICRKSGVIWISRRRFGLLIATSGYIKVPAGGNFILPASTSPAS